MNSPDKMQEMLSKVLQLATQETDSPDLRDRGYMYWRLLSADPAGAKQVVMATKPPITVDDRSNNRLMRQLVKEISMLASVYQKLPAQFVSHLSGKVASIENDEDEIELPSQQSVNAAANGELPADVMNTGGLPVGPQPGDQQPTDLLELDLDDEKPTPGTGSGTSFINDLLGNTPAPAPVAQQPQPMASTGSGPSRPNALHDMMSMSTTPQYGPKTTLLTADKGKGLVVEGQFVKRNNVLCCDWTLTNKSLVPLDGFALQFNKNSFGMMPSSPLNIPSQLMPSRSVQISVPIAPGGPTQLMNPITRIQMALKDSVGVFYFEDTIPMYMLFSENGAMEKSEYLTLWKEIPDEVDRTVTVPNTGYTPDSLANALRNYNLFLMAKKKNPEGHDVMYFSVKLVNNIAVLLEITLSPSSVLICVRSKVVQIIPEIVPAMTAVMSMLSSSPSSASTPSTGSATAKPAATPISLI